MGIWHVLAWLAHLRVVDNDGAAGHMEQPCAIVLQLDVAALPGGCLAVRHQVPAHVTCLLTWRVTWFRGVGETFLVDGSCTAMCLGKKTQLRVGDQTQDQRQDP